MSPTLFRSVVRLYLLSFALVLVSVLVVFMVGDFADRLNAYLDKPAADVAALYWNKLLVAVHQLAPAAMLLAAGVAVSTLRRRGEWTAMQALGMSRWAVVAPIAACTLALSGSMVAFDEWVATRAGTRVDRMMVERFQRWGDFRFYYVPRQWFRVGDTVFYVRGESEATRLADVSIFWLDRDFRLARRVDAERVTSLGGPRWLAEGVVDRAFGVDGQSSRAVKPSLELELAGTGPDTFRVQTGRPEHMRVGDLLAQLEIRGKVGLPTERMLLALHNRFAYPATGFAATMLAVLLALRPGRRGHLTLALVEGLVVTLVLFGVILVGKSLVLGEHVPPAGAAWAPIAALLLASWAAWWFSEHPLSPQRRGEGARAASG